MVCFLYIYKYMLLIVHVSYTAFTQTQILLNDIVLSSTKNAYQRSNPVFLFLFILQLFFFILQLIASHCSCFPIIHLL
jgi:hypothetical protein